MAGSMGALVVISSGLLCFSLQSSMLQGASQVVMVSIKGGKRDALSNLLQAEQRGGFPCRHCTYDDIHPFALSSVFSAHSFRSIVISSDPPMAGGGSGQGGSGQ